MKEKVPGQVKAEDLRGLIQANEDARQYFYSQADERWLEWLWINGFLDLIKAGAEDSTRYSYRTPEISYLVRMAEKVPKEVVDIILKVPISRENFNPEVLDRFSMICSGLPADQLARLVGKVRDDRWVVLMCGFDRWGMGYEKMLATLAGAGDYGSMFVLTSALLEVRPREEQVSQTGLSDNPFYIENLSYTKVFDFLAKTPDEHSAEALTVAVRVLSRIIALGDKAKPERAFPIEDSFHLLDVDFFDVEVAHKDSYSGDDNVRQLAAVVAILAGRVIGEKCEERDLVRALFERNFGATPQSRAAWRLRLFALSLCPEVFRDELDTAFFRVFEVESYYDILSGAEYLKALRKGFSVVPSDRKRAYVQRVLERFSKATGAEDSELLRFQGSHILSMIEQHLTSEEKALAQQMGFRIDTTYQPTPSIGPIRSGEVHSRAPISPDEFGRLAVEEIAKKLRSEWTPLNIAKRDTERDFLNPINAEGVSDLIKKDVAKRLKEYVDAAELFFDRESLDQHYTYSFLRGIQEAIKEHPDIAKGTDWEGLIKLAENIRRSGGQSAFDRTKRERGYSSAWLVGWDAVHTALTDVLQGLLTERDGPIPVDLAKYRIGILNLLEYLLSHPDPAPEDEQIGTAKHTIKMPGNEESEVSDPLSIAINSVRGRAFEALVMFANQDGKRFEKEAAVKIAEDVKRVYETVLEKENTRALMFQFGHYLPSFFFRDKEWIHGLFALIFPAPADKRSLYTASWEGYLYNNLYEVMFFDPEMQTLYKRGIALTAADYPKQRHFKDPNESIGVHLALAFMHYKSFAWDHSLFKDFWARDTLKQHSAFVSFLGRSFISGDNAQAVKLLESEPKSKKRLMALWDWLLREYKCPELFSEFGFWVSLDRGIFEPGWLAERLRMTLKKSNGAMDWDRGLTKFIVRLAEEAPEDSLEIVRLFLLEGAVRGGTKRKLYYLDTEWIEAMKVLFRKTETRAGTEALINELVRDGGTMFWALKGIVGEK